MYAQEVRMSHYYFLTGTDTDAGKTLIASALLQLAANQGAHTLGLKPVAAGAVDSGDGLRNPDAVALQLVSTQKLDYEQINPVLLKQAIAPHIAARRENKTLAVDRLVGFVRGALSMRPAGIKTDFCIIEGAGGWRVPLNPQAGLDDVAKALSLPVILVVGLKLGCLNHSLLTTEAISRDGLKIAAWVATQVDPQMQAIDENLQTLQQRLPFPCLGFVPWLESPSIDNVLPHLSVGPLYTPGSNAL